MPGQQQFSIKLLVANVILFLTVQRTLK